MVPTMIPGSPFFSLLSLDYSKAIFSSSFRLPDMMR